MKKILSLTLVLVLLFSFGLMAKTTAKYDKSQNKGEIYANANEPFAITDIPVPEGGQSYTLTMKANNKEGQQEVKQFMSGGEEYSIQATSLKDNTYNAWSVGDTLAGGTLKTSYNAGSVFNDYFISYNYNLRDDIFIDYSSSTHMVFGRGVLNISNPTYNLKTATNTRYIWSVVDSLSSYTSDNFPNHFEVHNDNTSWSAHESIRDKANNLEGNYTNRGENKVEVIVDGTPVPEQIWLNWPLIYEENFQIKIKTKGPKVYFDDDDDSGDYYGTYLKTFEYYTGEVSFSYKETN